MRLTLRTLLAYLDGSLEAADAQEIAKKIEESELATKLVHLIRDCTRRLRLGAPPLVGRGLGGDPNTVAEYLEYRLSDDRVTEFEKICLDSEIELAEVASCHQILTLVLGEPAEIAPQMRERLYALAAQSDAPPQQPPAPPAPKVATGSPVVPPAPPVVRRPKPEVPEYLRETRWRWWPVAALVLAAATLTFAGLLLFGPAELRERVTALGPAPEEAASESNEPAKQPEPEPAPPEKPAAQASSSQAKKEAEPPAVTLPKPSGEDPSAPPAPEPSEPKGTEATVDNTARPGEAPGGPEPVKTDKPATEDPLSVAPRPMPPDAPPETKPPVANTVPAPEPPGREPPESFGRYSKSGVLLKFDPATGNWLRVPALTPLSTGDRLLSLPLFQPTIQLSSNVTIQADGAALFELVGWTDEHIPILKVEFGRLLMMTVGRTDNSLQLRIDSHQPQLTFVDAESMLAIEVVRELPPGKDPESGLAPLTANVYATSGLVRVRDAGGEPVELRSPAQRSLAADTQPPAGAVFPEWVTSVHEQSDVDRRATTDVDGYLAAGKPAGLQLRELTSPDGGLGRRREVRTLAIRSLSYLGDFEAAVAVLNMDTERFVWPVAFEELRAAVARDPQTAKRVRETFENKRGVQDGDALYRMLWGYTAADLKNGADRELVEALASESVDFRVMSSIVLQNVTGKTHGYRPEDREINRRTAYNTWKKEVGRIVPRSQPPTKSRSGKTD